MKTSITIIFLILFTSIQAQINSGREQKYSPKNCDNDHYGTPIVEQPDCYPNYIVVFEDDFEGDFLDQSKWTPRAGPVRGWDPQTYEFDCSKATKQWYQSANVNVDEGKLILTVDDEEIYGTWAVGWDPLIEHSDWFDYRSGEIDSKKRFNYGYFEMACSLPATRGFYPAFWTFGDPIWSEIDFFEINTSTHTHSMTVHYDFNADGITNYCPETYSFSDFSNTHIYACEWTPFHISFYVDGNEKWRYYRFFNVLGQPIDCHNIHNIPVILNSKKLWPLEPGGIIANIGVWCNDNKPDASTIFPSTYEIEYIRYWMDIKNPNPIVISNTSELSLHDRYYNTEAGQYVLFKDNVYLHENDQLEVLAADYIDLLPGVEFGDASVVNLRIEEGMNTNNALKSGYKDHHPNNKQNLSIINDEKPESASKLYETLSQDFDVKIYPNPCDGRCISVRFPFQLDCLMDISIVNSFGFEIYRNKYLGSEIIVMDNLSLSAGLYLLNIWIAETGFTKSMKMIVE